MAAASRRWAADLLHVWFHQLRAAQWFGQNDAVDALLQRRFASRIARFSRRPAHEFLRDRLTARAAVLLFDQVPRNSFRGSPRAFATDPLARAITYGALRKGWLHGLTRQQRQFLLLPLMHSEARADQLLSRRLFARNGDASRRGFAASHARMIARFGRFPHRNAVLGRAGTAAEQRAIAAGNHW